MDAAQPAILIASRLSPRVGRGSWPPRVPPLPGGQPFLWEPSFHRAVDPGAVRVTEQGLAKKCGYGGAPLGGRWACPPAPQGSQCREASVLTEEDLGLA